LPNALTGRLKAAVLLVALGPQASASVIRHLREPEIEQLTVEVFSTDEISEEVVKEVLDESFEMTMATGLLGSGGYDYARQMLSGALGDAKATEILSYSRICILGWPQRCWRDYRRTCSPRLPCASPRWSAPLRRSSRAWKPCSNADCPV
jgi:hypothetical protein